MKQHKQLMKIAFTGLMAALSYVVFTFLQIKIPLPGGDATSIHLGNAVCVLGALLLGVSRTVAAEYTFFLAIPVMFGASLLKGVKFLAGASMTSMEGVILAVGMIVAFVVSFFVIKFLLGYIKKHDFKVFGYYRIALGIIVILFFLIRG